MNDQNESQSSKKGHFPVVSHGENEHALKQDQDKGKSVDSGYCGQLDEPDVGVLGRADESPRKTC